MITCCANGRVDGLLKRCVKQFGHDGDHFLGTVIPIEFVWEDKSTPSGYLHEAVNDDQVENVTGKLNDDAREDGYAYTEHQVKVALWNFFQEETERTQEELEERFHKLPFSKREKYLGQPGIDLTKENR